MTRDEMLIGWLCFIANHYAEDATVYLPRRIREELEAKGWYSVDKEPNWEGAKEAELTPSGKAIAYLNSADWGIEYAMETSK